MRKYFNKFIAVILAITIMMSFSLVAFAKDETQSFETNNNETVAKLYLMSCIYFFPISGHTWIYVENLSDEPIQVGLYEVPVGEGVSIGSFCFTAYDGAGIYYNLEAYRENKNDNQDSHYSISKELNRDELKALSDDIAGYVNYWDLYFNCAFFSFSTWNAATKGLVLIPMVLPGISQIQVMIAGGKKGSVNMYYPRRDQIFRQKGSKDNAKLVLVSDKTFNR